MASKSGSNKSRQQNQAAGQQFTVRAPQLKQLQRIHTQLAAMQTQIGTLTQAWGGGTQQAPRAGAGKKGGRAIGQAAGQQTT